MKFWELVLALPPDQYIAWVDHTLPDKKRVKNKDGTYVEKYVDPFTKPMKVGNITIERIGVKHNLYKKDIWDIKTFVDFKGRHYENGLIFFHVSDLQETKMHNAMYTVINNCKKNGWI